MLRPETSFSSVTGDEFFAVVDGGDGGGDFGERVLGTRSVIALVSSIVLLSFELREWVKEGFGF